MKKSLLVERDVNVPMRDGVVLRADVYRPNTSAALPVLLQRTPYGKGFASTSFALWAAESGYAVVIQDTRGRWSSDGDGYPFVSEMDDGFDTVEWAAAQPWSDGNVGMFGDSYVGYTQLAAAVRQPPALKAIIPSFTFCDPRAIMYAGGAFQLGAGVSWGLLAGAQMAIMRHPVEEAERMRWLGEFAAAVDGMSQDTTFRQVPLAEMPLIGQAGILPLLRDVLAHPMPDEFWQRVTCDPAHIQIPALHIGGWYDIFTSSTLSDFARLSARQAAPQKALIGPWVHSSIDGPVGEVDFGLSTYAMSVLPDELMLVWFDHWLKSASTSILEEPPIRLFVMGSNTWRNEHEWPLRRTDYQNYYLHSQGAANTLNGDGTLSLEIPAEEPPDHYLYDPRHPVPTRGGGLCCWQAALRPGAFDQRPVEARPDVLVYSTPPLQSDLEVTGPVRVKLWIASSTPDTDFTAKLVDVGPDGFARNVTDGIVRMRYRLGDARAWLNAGEIYPVEIHLAPTSNVFLAGHCLRLEISSSNFPRYDRNPNTQGDLALETRLEPALQTVFHTGQHPSHIVLPVIPGA